MIEIDVRTLPAAERHPHVFAAFDALVPGGGMELVSDHDPQPLLHSFQRTHAGRYDWSYLERGPRLFRIAIARRTPDRERQLTVEALLGGDHDRLDAILAEVRGLAQRAAWAEAAARFNAFRVGLQGHIRAEDQLLFPAFERLAGMGPQAGPTAVMRAEHREIEACLEAIATALAAGTPPDLEGLLAVLVDHNEKEEMVIYPTVDRLLAGPDLERLCLDMESA
jgi:uncharacterized protein (DUF2249 family)